MARRMVGFHAVTWHPGVLVVCWRRALRPRAHLRRRYGDGPHPLFIVRDEARDFTPEQLAVVMDGLKLRPSQTGE